MSGQPRVGYIGVGLMGHGAARHILLKGYRLTILGHRNRAPVEDLVAQGATEAHSPAEVARASEVVFLCLPSSVEVEATVLGENGVIEGLRPGTILVDSTSADPASTRRLGRILAERGIGLVDAPVGRTPREAELGKLSTLLGGDPAHVARVRPIVACRMAEAAPAAAFVAQACSQVWQMALAQGHGERFMPVLPEIVARLSRGHVRDLPE